MKKNIIITILATALVSITLLIIVGLIANAQDKKVEETITPTVNKFRDAFAYGCTSEGANYSYCTCVYDDVVKNNGQTSAHKIFIDMANSEIVPETIMQSITKCLPLY